MKGVNFWLVIRHIQGRNARETALGPMSLKQIRKTKKQHRADTHDKRIKCAMGVERR